MRPGFVVLPDTAATSAVRAVLPWQAPRVCAHASGRPWLVGHWPLDAVTVTAAGPVRVAVIGICPAQRALRRRSTGTPGFRAA